MINDEPEMRLASAFDLERLPPSFYDDPYPTYAELRRASPQHRCPDGSWFLTRYADLDAIYRDRRAFSSDKKVAFAPKFGDGTPLFEHHTTSLVFNDPPYHTRVRRRIVGALTPAAIKQMVPTLEHLVDALCDVMAAKGEVDLVEDFAAAIPIEVIGNLLGVPHDERGPLRAWSLAILGALDPALSHTQLELGQQSVADFLQYTQRLVNERRTHLRSEDDLLSRLIRDEPSGERLSERELLHNCIFLLNAGHETTTNLIANGLALLLANDNERAQLTQHATPISTAVEECLRFESPNQLGNRLVIEPVEIGGRRFEAGTYLTLCIGAANRDPNEFRDADRFDVTREPNHHLAFAAGAHACAGMSVARIEAQIALARFLERFPRARLLTGAKRGRRARFRGWTRLPAAVE